MRKLFLLLLICWACKGIAQVNLQTGASQISIPLFSYSDNDNLNCNVSLNYIDGNGLKVSEVASSVGTGWEMKCGGVITREQRGLPDDQKRSETYSNPLPANQNMTFDEYDNTYFPNGYLFSAYSPSDHISNEGAWVKTYQYPTVNPASPDGNIPKKESISADREQDIFHLNYGMTKADFVIGKNGQIKVLNDSRIKIEMFQSNLLNSNIKTRIDHFIVTGTDGIQYIFSDKELSLSCTYDKARFADSNGNFSLDENPSTGGDWVVGGVPNPGIPIFMGQKTQNYIVTKWYLSKILNPRTSKAIIFNYDQFDVDILGPREFGCIVQTGKDDIRSLTITREVIKALRLKTIVCPTSEINFVYGASPRVDLPNGLPLEAIEISNQNIWSKKYLFQYDYFFKSEIKPYSYAFNSTESIYARLCLKSVQEVNNDTQTTLPPYLFYYYTGGTSSDDIVPPTFSYFTDHWGFFNAHVLYDYPVQPNQIPYGSTISNICINAATVRSPIDRMAQNGIIKEIKYPLGGSLTYEYEQNDAFFNQQNVVVGGVRTTRTILFNGISHDKDKITDYKYLKNDETSSSGWGYELPEYSNPMNVRIYKEAGGGVAKTFGDFAGLFATSFVFAKGLSFTPKFNHAVLGFAQAIIFQILIDVFTSSDPEYKDQNELIYSSISNQDGNSLPYQYSRVEEINKTLQGDDGETVYEFTSNIDKPIDILTLSFPYSEKDRYDPWAYGLLKTKAVYDNSTPRQIINATINNYNFISSFMSDPNYMSKKWEPNRILYDAFPSVRAPFDYIGETDITEAPVYYPQTGHTELTSTSESNYSADHLHYINKTTNYTYDPINNQVNSISTTDSKGDLIQQKIYYPEDYTVNGFIQDMKDANIVNTPVSTETWITKPGGQPEMISSKVTEYGVAPNGDIKPLKTDELYTSAPLTESEIGTFDPASVIRNSTFIKGKNEMTYSDDGNNIEIVDLIGNRVSSNIYDYDHQYTIAKVTNAYQKDIAYTSFEADGTGGWMINSGNILYGEGGITGDNRFSGNLSKTFSAAGDYNVTLWVKGNSTASVNGASGTLVSTLNDWKLYSWKLNSVSSVSVQGTDIDEVRLYPDGARMTTFTYDPGIGKTAECDINNHIQYFNYDDLGRLIYIRDENNNIVKSYCYNYAGQTENCTYGYTNDEQNGTFTSHANCLPGAIARTYDYTIPAGTYTSYISKDDANQLAKDALNTQGQANADALPCSTYNIYLTNNSGYTGYTFPMYIDGVLHNFPADGTSNVLTATIPAGNHVFNFPCGPTSSFTMTPNSTPIPAACGSDFMFAVNTDITFSFYPLYSVTCSMTNASDPLSISGFCSTGNTGTISVYSTNSTIGPGSHLYYDANKMQPVNNMQWVRPWSGTGKTIYAVNSGGVVQSTTYSQSCP